MSNGFIRIKRKEALELLRTDLNAFLLLMLQALEARWHDDPNILNLNIGESVIGKKEVETLFGWTKQQYREVKKRNTLKYKKSTYQGTPLGTRAKLVDNSFCVLFQEKENTPNNTPNNTEKNYSTTQQQHTYNTPTTPNQERRRKKEEKEESDLSIDKSSSSHPQPPKGGERERKGKPAYKHKGPISEDAYRLSEQTIRDRITCSADIIQSWIDELDGRLDLVEQEIQEVAVLKAKGQNIFSAPRLIGFRITSIKSTFRPTLERRTTSNLEYAKSKFETLELEGYQRIDYGCDIITIKHLKQKFQIFYASPTFKEEIEVVMKFLKEHKEKVVNIKEA